MKARSLLLLMLLFPASAIAEGAATGDKDSEARKRQIEACFKKLETKAVAEVVGKPANEANAEAKEKPAKGGGTESKDMPVNDAKAGNKDRHAHVVKGEVQAKSAPSDTRTKEEKYIDGLFGCFKEVNGKAGQDIVDEGYVTNDRIHKFNELDGKAFKDLKCSKYDNRKLRMCPQAGFFDPSARIYFDVGSDEDGEIDLFRNGSLEPGLTFASVAFPWRLGRSRAYDPWTWGPELGVGISSSPEPADDGQESSSPGAPVVLLTLGAKLVYEVSQGSSFGLEAGYAAGFSSDESFDDYIDSAIYVGLKVNIVVPTKAK